MESNILYGIGYIIGVAAAGFPIIVISAGFFVFGSGVNKSLLGK